MKHIDCAQEWVRILRDEAICLPTWVGTDDNLADIFTKILSVEKFRIMRGHIIIAFIALWWNVQAIKALYYFN